MQSALCHDVARRTGASLTPEYLTPHQVSELTGFTPRALEAMRSRRQGPPYSKVGSGKRSPIRYRADRVRAWMESFSNPED